MKIKLLVDNECYIKTNCYQHQLLLTISKEHIVELVELDAILSSRLTKKNHDRILSCLKLRTLDRNLQAISQYLGDESLYVYEQDPWESFKDDSPYKGAYDRINGKLNVTSFLNTSKWWSDFLTSRNLPSKFVHMWMLPEYCTNVPEWNNRKIDVGFCGQLHSHRKDFFDKLRGHGINVALFPQVDYAGYLSMLSNTKIYVHNEHVNWRMDEVNIRANAMWIKDVEACARGCISIRDDEEEKVNYTKGMIPALMTYDIHGVDAGARECAKIINDVLSSPARSADVVSSSVDYIRSAPGWKTVIEAIV